MTKLNAKEMLRLSQSKKVIILDKQKSNFQAWVDARVRHEIDVYCLNNGKKKQDVAEQALVLYMFLVTNDKLDEVVEKYLPKNSVEKDS